MNKKTLIIPTASAPALRRRLTLILAIILTLALTLPLLTGCGKPKVVGVKSLAAANISAQSKVKNYHMDGTADMDISLDPEQIAQESEDLAGLLDAVDLKLPVEMTMAADSGTDTAHVTTEAGVRLFGKSVDLQTAEFYIDMKNQAAHAKSGDSAEWKKTDYQDHQLNLKQMAGGLAIIGKTVLENAAFEETDEAYTLTMPAEKAGDLIADMHLLDCVDVGIADVRDIAVEGGQIIYNVDKTTLLVSSIELKDVDIRGKGVYKGASVDLRFPANATFTFSRYNELEESEYAIPAEVRGEK